MITLRFDQLAAVTGGTLHPLEAAPRLFSGVAIDSRVVAPSQLFVAIRGERFDGHDFVAQAAERGAAGVVASNKWLRPAQMPSEVALVAVADTHEAMIRLARHYRESLSARFIGVTGSNGKTTTKEFIYALLQAVAGKAYRSGGNLNNLFGVPLALFAIPADTAVAVIEMGISTNTEMPRLAAIVQPDVAVITNVGPSHLEFLGSVEGVARAKLEILRSDCKDVTAVVNGDNAILMQHVGDHRGPTVTFGLDRPADYRPDRVATDEDGCTVVSVRGCEYRLPLPGRHQIANLLAAIAAVESLGYNLATTDTRAIELTTAPMRGEMVRRRGARIVADCYNANPESVKAGLEAFARIPSEGRRIVILGDMLELGAASPELHRGIGRLLGQYRFDLALLVGPQSRATLDGARGEGIAPGALLHFADASACAASVASILRPGDLVFLKASRGVGLERVLRALEQPEENH